MSRAGRRRWNFLPRSLSNRLVLFVVALVVVVIVAAGGATYVALKSFLISRLDQQVGSLATDNMTEVRQSLLRCEASGQSSCPLGPRLNPDVHMAQRQWEAILDPSGTQVLSATDPTGEFNVMQLSDAQRRDLVNNPDATHTWTHAGRRDGPGSRSFGRFAGGRHGPVDRRDQPDAAPAGTDSKSPSGRSRSPPRSS